MPFEIKILDKIHCPRCNGMAELRIDQKKTDNKWVLVYIVCPVCRLNRYSYATTKRAAKIQYKINKLKNNPKITKKIIDRIERLEEIKRGAEKEL